MLGWWLAAAEAADEEPVGDGVALSVGTGPRPLSQVTLGLTGLGARVLLPGTTLSPWVGLQATRAAVSAFDQGERDDRYTSSASAVHGSLGLRWDLTERKARSVSPYVIAGALAGRAAVASRDVADDQKYVSATTTVAGTAGLGFDGFLSRHVSLGGELGAIGGVSSGSSASVDGGNKDRDDEKVQTTVLTSFTGVMLTVWR